MSYEPIVLTQYVSDTINEMVKDGEEFGKIKLTDILSRMAGDRVVESDGDQSDFGKWFALFEFNFWEIVLLSEATRPESISATDYPIGESQMFVTYVSTDWGRSFAIGKDYYRELQEKYVEFLRSEAIL